jgi:hypothetical protein
MKLQQQQHAHIPFGQLSTADRFLYWICANVAIGLLRPLPHMTKEIGEDIIRIWDEQKFAPVDVLDGFSMAERLKPHLFAANLKIMPEKPPTSHCTE